MVLPSNSSRIPRQRCDKVKHGSILIGYGRCSIVLFQSTDELVIESYATQKLCVRFDSIMTPVQHGDDGGDHLVLSSGEWEVR
jgi:hypothetical protein